MNTTDPVADLLTRIRNAIMAHKQQVSAPASKLKQAILDVLKAENFVSDYSFEKNEHQGVLDINLAYTKQRKQQVSNIRGLKRISKPGRRIYRSAQEIKSVRNGLGVAIVSTPKGVLSDKAAREQNVGGELLCEVW